MTAIETTVSEAIASSTPVSPPLGELSVASPLSIAMDLSAGLLARLAAAAARMAEEEGVPMSGETEAGPTSATPSGVAGGAPADIPGTEAGGVTPSGMPSGGGEGGKGAPQTAGPTRDPQRHAEGAGPETEEEVSYHPARDRVGSTAYPSVAQEFRRETASSSVPMASSGGEPQAGKATWQSAPGAAPYNPWAEMTGDPTPPVFFAQDIPYAPSASAGATLSGVPMGEAAAEEPAIVEEDEPLLAPEAIILEGLDKTGVPQQWYGSRL